MAEGEETEVTKTETTVTEEKAANPSTPAQDVVDELHEKQDESAPVVREETTVVKEETTTDE